MTVVLSLVCSDGLIMAADTQVTDGDREMSYPAQKLHPLGDRAAWAGSGARSVLTDLERLFEDSAGAILESEDVGHAIQERVVPVLEHHYSHFIADVPGEVSDGTPSAYVLAAGYSGDQPWIVEVNPQGMVSRYEDVGFHAIGSGAPMAHQAGALLAHFNMVERPVRYGEVVALRVLAALSRSAPSVGGEFDICRLTPDGAHHLSDRQLATATKNLARWEDLEQAALDDLFD